LVGMALTPKNFARCTARANVGRSDINEMMPVQTGHRP